MIIIESIEIETLKTHEIHTQKKENLQEKIPQSTAPSICKGAVRNSTNSRQIGKKVEVGRSVFLRLARSGRCFHCPGKTHL